MGTERQRSSRSGTDDLSLRGAKTLVDLARRCSARRGRAATSTTRCPSRAESSVPLLAAARGLREEFGV